MDQIKKTEKGWPGHFIASDSCLFRRHTLLEFKDIAITVSTVGNWKPWPGKDVEEVGAWRYFETMVFHSKPISEKEPWKDADVSRQINFRSPWSINEAWREQEANDMHEAVVQEIADRLLNGDTFIIQED